MSQISVVRLNVSIKRYYLEHHNLRLSTGDINGGDCMLWTGLAHAIFGGELYSVGMHGGHAFIKLGGKFYDAETFRGVSDWRKLGGFKDDRPGVLKDPVEWAEKQNWEGFKAHWKGCLRDSLIKKLTTIYRDTKK